MTYEIDYRALVGKMTLEEKASLMSGENFWYSQSLPQHGIPAIMLTDGPHGLRKQIGDADHLGINGSVPATCFPTAATIANSWDVDLIREMGVVLGTEAAAESISVVLGPGMNIKRDPLSGRNFEYFSEDPYLSGKLSSALIRGMQEKGIAACAKHFAVNSQEYLRMTIDEIVDKRALHELYLESFRMAVQEGKVISMMTSYNKVNGIYTNENDYLLNTVLKKTWGFDGLIVTDWGGNNDRVAGLKAGNQLEMPSTIGVTDLEIVNAVRSGDLEESLLDTRVLELLKVVNKIKPLPAEAADMEAHHEKAVDIASQSMVLLKNKDNCLPLNPKTKVTVIGDFAETPRYQGAGSSSINAYKLDNLLNALDETDIEVVAYAKGFERYGNTKKAVYDKALQAAGQADTLLVFLGLDESYESEGVDRSHLDLPQDQITLINQLTKLNKKIIVLLAGGAVMSLPFINEIDACIHTYLAGQGGGKALAKILTGEVNPSGKLSETYPLSYEDVSSAGYFPGKEAISEHRESIFIGYRYFDTKKIPVQFEFGFGLSYTSFTYNHVMFEDNHITLEVTNTGAVGGSDVVQVYVHKKDSPLMRADQELKGFAKVPLQAHEKKRVTIELSDHAFHFYNVETESWAIEEGAYEIRVGSSSRTIHQVIEVTKNGIQAPVTMCNIPKSYKELDIHNISDSDFEALVGYKLPDSNWDRKAPVNLNTSIVETATKGVVGKFVNWIILRMYKNKMKKGEPHAANAILLVQSMPFRTLSRMTGGSINEEMLAGMMMAVDGHFFKGTTKVIKNIPSKKSK